MAHFIPSRPLQRRGKECQLDSFYSYYRGLISQQREHRSCRDCWKNLTSQRDSFVRNKARLDRFNGTYGESAAQAGCRDYGVRIWSAGCHGTRKPYTIALLVDDANVVLLSAQSSARRISRFRSPWYQRTGGRRSWPAHSIIGLRTARRAPTVSITMLEGRLWYRLRYSKEGSPLRGEETPSRTVQSTFTIETESAAACTRPRLALTRHISNGSYSATDIHS